MAVHSGAVAVYRSRMRGVRAGGVLLMSAGLVAGLLVAALPGASASTAVAGKSCKVVGQQAVDAQGRTLVCKKNRKGKLVWTLKKVTPTPTPNGPPYEWSGSWAQGWTRVGAPTACPANLSAVFIRAPFDVDDVVSIVRPGYLNPHSGYKPHSHVRYSPSDADGRQVIYAPADGWLYSAARYQEAYTPGNDQVILDFFADCGVMWRFDHLRDGTLSTPLAAAIANVPLREDSRTTRITPVRVKAGEVIATAVGATSCEVGRPLCLPPGGPNLFVDFGVYDPRQLNESARSDPSFLADAQGSSFKGIGLCWIDLFPASKAAIEAKAEGISDYCER